MKNNKFLLGLVSFLFPGLGHIFLGRYKKGFSLLFLTFGLMFLAVGIPFFSFFVVGICIFAVIDILNEIEKKNNELL